MACGGRPRIASGFGLGSLGSSPTARRHTGLGRLLDGITGTIASLLVSLSVVAAADADAAGRVTTPDLILTAAEGGRVVNGTATPISEGARRGLRLDERPGQGVAWIKGLDFGTGTIEADLRGKDVLQRSFVGIAFHGVDDSRYEVVYVRPFNFRAQDPVRRSHAIQYAAHPDYPWSRLRSERSGEFENGVDLGLDPNDWVHLRIEVSPARVRAFVADTQAATLDVPRIVSTGKGSLGLWVGEGSGGDFANLRVEALAEKAGSLGAGGPDPFVVSRRANDAYRAGDYALAEKCFRELATAYPGLPAALTGLGRALARLGREEEALEWLARAADVGADTDTAEVAEAFGERRDAPRVRALLARFRGNRRPVARSQVALTLPEKDLMPESVAYDPASGTFYFGSMNKRKIVAVRDGSIRDFVPSGRDGLGTVLGMKLDAGRGELWANSCGPLAGAANPGGGTVFHYDLRTGSLLSKYEAPDAQICFNDLAIAPGGDVYVSAGDNGIFRISRESDRLELFVAATGLLVNGIAASGDGRRLYLADFARGIVALDVPSRSLRVLEVPPGASLVAIDGLYVHGRSLVGIQNGRSARPEKVLQAFLDETGERVACVDLLERNHPAYDAPTTGVVVGDELLYVAGSQLNKVGADGSCRPLRASARARCCGSRCGGTARPDGPRRAWTSRPSAVRCWPSTSPAASPTSPPTSSGSSRAPRSSFSPSAAARSRPSPTRRSGRSSRSISRARTMRPGTTWSRRSCGSRKTAAWRGWFRASR